MKNWKRFGVIALTLLLVVTLLPLGSFKALAKEGEGESEALGATYKVGDIIKFGHYEQDGNLENGKEEIEWQVLKVESNKALVISRYALEIFTGKLGVDEPGETWETFFLRKWLNNDFKKAAFTSKEQKYIPTVTVANNDSAFYGVDGGNDTQDQIFCLSVNEVRNLFDQNSFNSQYYSGQSQKMMVEPTQYVLNQFYSFGMEIPTISKEYYDSYLKGLGYTSDVIGFRGVDWWLRSPGSWTGSFCHVDFCGFWPSDSMEGFDNIAVRPSLYINISGLEPVNPNPEYPKEIKYSGYTTTFDPAVLSRPSTYAVCNPNLAEFCAILCQAVYHNYSDDEDWKVFEQLGINENEYVSKIEKFSPYSYSIAYKKMVIGGEDTNVIIFALRGTQSDLSHPYEAIADWYWGESVWTVNGKSGFREYTVYKYCSDYGKKVFESYQALLAEKPELKQNPTKIIITGHSLGGATANLLGAVFSDNIYRKDDVFVYTFGAIDCLPVKTTQQVCTISKGYENIHNIYNFKDTFGPNGTHFLSRFAAGRSGYGKYGHIDIFTTDLDTSDMKNHYLLESYFPAVFGRKVKYGKNWRVVAMHCPVDINVYKDGEMVAKVTNSIVDDSVTSIPTKVIDDEKYFLIEEDSDYQFEITATEEGSMEYEVLDVETGSDSKEFQNVQLAPGKTMVSFVDSETDNKDVKLLVENESGKIVTEVLEDGEEIPATAQAIFRDVAGGAWYVSAVQYAYDNDIMTGKSKTTFAPNSNLLREEFTQIIYKNEGKPNLSITDNPFTDVKNAWYKDSVLWAKEKGIVSGKSVDRFGIGKNITREELALMLYKYAQYKNFDTRTIANDNLRGYSDGHKVSSWALEAVKWAVERGIISGKRNERDGYRIDPQKGATRAECAAMIKRFIEINEGNWQIVLEEEEEPLALPEEAIEEDVIAPDEETDVIIDEEDEEEEEKTDEEDKDDVHEDEIKDEDKETDEEVIVDGKNVINS